MKLNLNQLLRKRLIEKPNGYLVKNGFPKHVSAAPAKRIGFRVRRAKEVRFLYCRKATVQNTRKLERESFADTFVQGGSSVLRMKFSANNPRHRKPPKR